jgi:hypothetical protein
MADATLQDTKLRKDLKVLATFMRIYCDGEHRDQPRAPVTLKMHDVAAVYGRPVVLCASCRKLLQHAFVKRAACPLDPKPMCKHCPSHCYAPNYRAQVREVMRVAGKRLVWSGRLDYLWHLLF